MCIEIRKKGESKRAMERGKEKFGNNSRYKILRYSTLLNKLVPCSSK
jgi:hypothetical protein